MLSYALYLTNDAVATITGGEFIGGNDWSGGLAIEGTSAVVSGDNDTGLPYRKRDSQGRQIQRKGIQS